MIDALLPTVAIALAAIGGFFMGYGWAAFLEEWSK